VWAKLHRLVLDELGSRGELDWSRLPLVKGISPIGSRCGPRRSRPAKLYADKGYDYGHLRRWLSARGIRHRIARKGVDSSQRLGRHRWTIERMPSSPAAADSTAATNESRALLRLHQHRLHPHLLPQTRQMR
jgi:hypothetical protein